MGSWGHEQKLPAPDYDEAVIRRERWAIVLVVGGQEALLHEGALYKDEVE